MTMGAHASAHLQHAARCAHHDKGMAHMLTAAPNLNPCSSR